MISHSSVTIATAKKTAKGVNQELGFGNWQKLRGSEGGRMEEGKDLKGKRRVIEREYRGKSG